MHAAPFFSVLLSTLLLQSLETPLLPSYSFDSDLPNYIGSELP